MVQNRKKTQQRFGKMEEQQPSMPNQLDLIQPVNTANMAELTFAGGAAKLTWGVLTDFGM